MKVCAETLVVAASLLAAALCAAAQERQGPIRPASPPDITRIPVNSTPEPPPVPVAEIIQRFTQKEDELLQARAGYTYHKTIRVMEIGADGKPSGELRVVTEPAVASDGKRYEREIETATSTLHQLKLAPEDLDVLGRMPMFILTTEQLAKYDLTYAGAQQVDELNTYAFRVKPKQVERTRAYFEGIVWVDDKEFVVVKTYGRWLTETGEVSSPELPFKLFESYRENIDGKYWFPAYIRADDTLQRKQGDVPIRLTVRWTDYKPAAGQPSGK